MNRSIKYRAWNKKANKMWTWETIHRNRVFALSPNLPYTDFIVLPNSEDVELMQFTGEYDKNKVEIYEDDLVKKLNCIGRVVFKDGAFVIENGKNWHWKTKPVGHDINKGIEVVGNIFENPELLEDVDKIIADWKLKKDKEGNYYVIKETYYKKED